MRNLVRLHYAPRYTTQVLAATDDVSPEPLALECLCGGNCSLFLGTTWGSRAMCVEIPAWRSEIRADLLFANIAAAVLVLAAYA